MKTAAKKANGSDTVGRIFNGQPAHKLTSAQKWIRLLIHDPATPEDKKAAELFGKLADALKKSDYGAYYVLSIFELSADQERQVGELPRIDTYPPVVGFDAVAEYLTSDIRDVQKH